MIYSNFQLLYKLPLHFFFHFSKLSSYNFILPNVGNAGYGNFWWASNDSALFIMLTIRTTNNPALVNESFYWLNITVDYDENSSPLTEDVALKYSTDQPELSEVGECQETVNITLSFSKTGSFTNDKLIALQCNKTLLLDPTIIIGLLYK